LFGRDLQSKRGLVELSSVFGRDLQLSSRIELVLQVVFCRFVFSRRKFFLHFMLCRLVYVDIGCC
jgi:hypothetical protein